jgi:hypothetical protein
LATLAKAKGSFYKHDADGELFKPYHVTEGERRE